MIFSVASVFGAAMVSLWYWFFSGMDIGMILKG